MGSITNSLSLMVNKALLFGRQKSPQIMIGCGLIGGAATVVLSCIATTKASEIMGEASTELETIDKVLKDHSDDGKYTQEDAKSDRRKVYVRTGLNLAKTYALPACTGLASTALILGGTHILNSRNAVLATSLAASVGELADIRKRMIDKFGEEEGKALYSELRHGTETLEIKEKVTDEKGKTKTVKKTIRTVKEDYFDGYSRIFDCRNPYWDKDSTYCQVFLEARQSMFNDKLRAYGYVFLNEVLEELGFPKTRVGQEVGWIFDPENPNIDNYIDFDITPVEVLRKDGENDYTLLEDGTRNSGFLLDFNVDGSVLNKVDWPDKGEIR